MFVASGYQVSEQIYASAQSLIYRASRELDGEAVILKVLKDAQPSPTRIARFKREYKVVSGLELPGVVRAHDFMYATGHWVLVLEDFGGESLARLGLAGELELDAFLDLACEIAGHLAAIHQEGLIHKDINPANIVFSPDSGLVKIIDFGIASQMSREAVSFEHPSLVEGTPNYVSPEQTGRISQAIDQRTDLYSLGCTFYELLAGSPPFESEGGDLHRLLHCHLAREPEPLSSRAPAVPTTVAQIIDKLLAKDAAERYQSARGLEVDLLRCRRDYTAQQRVSTFELGQRDAPVRLAPPSRLFGREHDVERLRSSFARVRTGATELVLVSGSPGIGKSALVREMYRPVTQERGFFAAGKFDQFQRDTPYHPLREALDHLVGQLLMEPPQQMQRRAQALQEATGSMLSVLVEIVPRLEHLYERLPPPPTLPVAELKPRFMRALVGCVELFASAERPLVLFIDDLQWADSPSLELIKLLMTEPVPHFLMIGAFRDNEVGAAHPLRTTVDELRGAGVELTQIELGPLRVEDSRALVANALRRRVDDVDEVVELLHQKTGGNPFFIHALLETLASKQVVELDHCTNQWSWDLDAIRLLELSDNVVDFVLDAISELPQQTRELLALAACIGNVFELGLLAAATGQSLARVVAGLMPGLAENYLIPTSGDYRLIETEVETEQLKLELSYKFAHDRIQQAAYGLLSPEARGEAHLKLGRAMSEHFGRPLAGSQLMATVGQLNRATHLLAGEERLALARLNLEAGRRAMVAVAHARAAEHFERSLCLMGEREDPQALSPTDIARAFARDYELAHASSEGAAEAGYLAGDYVLAERYVDALLANARELLDKINVTQTWINVLTAQNDFGRAIERARELLGPLGIELPHEPTLADVDALHDVVAAALDGRDPRSLVDMPALAEPIPLATLHVLESITTSTFLVLPMLFPLVVGNMVLLTLRHGISSDSVHGFIHYGLTLCARGDYALGYGFGCLAEELIERDPQFSAHLPSLAAVGGCYIFHWFRPNRHSIEVMRRGYRVGLEQGNVEAATIALQGSVAMRYWAGLELGESDAELFEVSEALQRHKQIPFYNWNRIYHQAARNFIVEHEDPSCLQGQVYDELAEMPAHEQSGDLTAVFGVWFNKALLAYNYHQYDVALDYAGRLEQLNQAGSLLAVIANFYHCLALLATLGDVEADEREPALDKARALTETMGAWANNCQANYGHKYHLMSAELCRVLEERAQAREHYDLAIDLARDNEHMHEHGLALERAAMFYLEQGNARLAGYYMRDAYYAFERWGAAAKLRFLEHEYAYLLESRSRSRARERAETGTSTKGTGEFRDLDLDAVLAATRAITKELDISTMLETIMRVSLENAGADRGYLILARDEQLLVKVYGELGERSRFESRSLSLDDEEGLAHTIVQYVARTAEPVVLANASADAKFGQDEHLRSRACKSVLCMPLLNQGRLMGITYLENNRAAGVFDEDRLDVLALLMGQAAVSLEIGLLKDTQAREFQYRVGGSLPADASTYIRRKADDLLSRHLHAGDYCHVFNARQMGKSSLRVHVADRLARAGFECASIDLSAIGSSGIRIEQWYAGVARSLVSSLGLLGQIKLGRWWRAKAELSPVHRLDVLVDEEILPRVEGSLAIFIDEVDAVLALEFAVDDFFALLRSFYNRRAEDPRYGRLSVVLLGVSTPSDLIADKRRTPYNVGHAVPLAGFRFDEARRLLPGLTAVGDAERLLRAVLDWTCGQPFLTQKICRLLNEDGSHAPAGKERDWVAGIVRARVLDKWRQHDTPEHLQTIEARLLHAPEQVPALLSRYRDILAGGLVEAEDTALDTVLTLSGLVTRSFGKVEVGNPIYAAIFDRAWMDRGLELAGGVKTGPG